MAIRKHKIMAFLESRFKTTAFNELISKDEQEGMLNMIIKHSTKFINDRVIITPSATAKKVWAFEHKSNGKIYIEVPNDKWDIFREMLVKKYQFCMAVDGPQKNTFVISLNPDDFLMVTDV